MIIAKEKGSRARAFQVSQCETARIPRAEVVELIDREFPPGTMPGSEDEALDAAVRLRVAVERTHGRNTARWVSVTG